ncbi:MAG TPA: type IV secretion system DNA-binding domain-containing protein [Vitreimonas sp.]|nr:type IV secretion system DNA-binding domain-containing protein [Vitreimonas sp.]
MSSPHVVLDIRTARNSETTAEALTQFFATLPYLYDQPWYTALGQDEHLSLEIVVLNQTIYFLAYVPVRVQNYFTSLIQATYPESLITPLDFDPLVSYLVEGAPLTPEATPTHLEIGHLTLSEHNHYPLKTIHQFKDTDSLSHVLSLLSKTDPQDMIGIQIVLRDSGERWKNGAPLSLSSLAQATLATAPAEGNTAEKSSGTSDQKLASTAWQTSIKLLVRSSNYDQAYLLLETIASAYQSTSHSEGNTLVLKQPWFFKNWFLNRVKNRTIGWGPRQPLTLEEMAAIYHFPNKKLTPIHNIAWGKLLLGEPPENLPVVTKDMAENLKRDINPFARVLYKNSHVVYGLKRADRRRHMYVIGKTGTGKSTLLANMAINDLKNDEGLCVIDPHGDLVETLLNYIPSRRINDVVYFDPSDPDRTVKINLFEGQNVVHRELIASGIVSVFQKLYSYSWGPRLEYILRNALLTLLKTENARMSDIVDLLVDDKFRAKTIENLDDPILQTFWTKEFDQMPPRLRSEAIAPILNKVGQFVSSPLVRNVVNAHKSSFSIEDIMDQGKILLVNLSQGRLGEDNATLLGAMLITKIQLAAMSRVNVAEEERKDFYLYVDEFQNFATQSFNKILSEARKYRLNLTLANQYIAQIPEDVQKAIFGNCGSIISFVMGADDAAVFEKEYGEKYSKEDLVTLSRYQIINKITVDDIVSLPFPALTLPIAKSSNHNRDKVVKVSRERWATKK